MWRISSVAYAADERLSEANTARAVGLPSRSCASWSVLSGRPRTLFLSRNDRPLGDVDLGRGGKGLEAGLFLDGGSHTKSTVDTPAVRRRNRRTCRSRLRNLTIPSALDRPADPPVPVRFDGSPHPRRDSVGGLARLVRRSRPEVLRAAHRSPPAARRRARPHRRARSIATPCSPCPSRPGPSWSPAWPPDPSRQPLVVAVPTTGEAERLAHDLAAFLGADEVELFPAWETLPFERVSPAVETMGRRLRTLWRLRDPERRAPGAWSRRSGPWCSGSGPHVEDVEPIVVGAGDQVDPTSSSSGSSRAGYRREYQVEHRGEVAVRGSIVDVFPSHRRRAGAHRPVGRRGRPAHRVLGRRPALDDRRRPRSRSSRAASCCPPTRCGRGPRRWSRPSRGAASSGSASPRARCSTAWSRGCRGSPRRRRRARRCSTCSTPTRRCCWSSRAACATGPADILAEEADLARTLAATWGAERRRPLPAPAPRLRPAAGPHRRAGVDASPPRPRGPTSPPSPPPAGTRSSATAPRLVGQLDAAARPTATASSSPPTAPARPTGSIALLGDQGVAPAPSTTRAPPTSPSPAATSWSRRSSGASSCRR